MSSDALRTLSQQLHRTGLPRDYVDRLCREIAEHQEDLGEVPLHIKTTGLVRAAVREYRSANWSGRNPIVSWLACAILPLVNSIVGILGLVLMVAWIHEEWLPRVVQPYIPVTMIGLELIVFTLAWIVAVGWLNAVSHHVGRGCAWWLSAFAAQCFMVATCAFEGCEDGLNCEFHLVEWATWPQTILNPSLMVLAFVWFEVRRWRVTEHGELTVTEAR